MRIVNTDNRDPMTTVIQVETDEGKFIDIEVNPRLLFLNMIQNIQDPFDEQYEKIFCALIDKMDYDLLNC